MGVPSHLAFLVLLVLSGSPQTTGQSRVTAAAFAPATLPNHADSSESAPDPTEDPGHVVPEWTHNPSEDGDETSTPVGAIATVTDFKSHRSGTSSSTATSSPIVMTTQPHVASSAGRPSSAHPPPASTATDGGTPLTQDPRAAFSSPPNRAVPDVIASTTRTADRPPTSAAAPSPSHQEVPPELNVGDDDFKGRRHRPSSPLDPLLAALLSAFIVTTAIVFVVLFLRFRQRNTHPEFHRLQDLPMDDLMEDTPLSRYSY